MTSLVAELISYIHMKSRSCNEIVHVYLYACLHSKMFRGDKCTALVPSHYTDYSIHGNIFWRIPKHSTV